MVTTVDLPESQRIVITGIGLTAPNGNDLQTYRQALLNHVSGVQPYEIRYVGKTLAGICNYDALRYQKKEGHSSWHPRGQRSHLLQPRSSRE